MIDLARGMEDRNDLIRHRSDRCSPANLILGTLTVLLFAGALLFCLWVRFRVTEIGYEMQELEQTRIALERTRAALTLEEETLKHPQRIERIARNELGMMPAQPWQILPAGISDREIAAPTSLAMAGLPVRGAGSRKTVPVN